MQQNTPAVREFFVLGQANVDTFTLWHVCAAPEDAEESDTLFDSLATHADQGCGTLVTEHAASACEAVYRYLTTLGNAAGTRVTLHPESNPAALKELQEYRPDLLKRRAPYFVVTDDRRPVEADLFQEGHEGFRVVHVERETDHDTDAAREAQLSQLANFYLTYQPLRMHCYTATSRGQAAAMARQDHARTLAAERMAEAVNRHLKSAPRQWRGGSVLGWVAVRNTDGSSDGRLYADAEDARNAQPAPRACIVFPLTTRTPFTVDDCRACLA
ncbi:hypothetical protein [Streptomyces sp. NPDC051561]|uniref:hypothetical protein n=1 Tax=Streptomyces sp. NPDC051561 TaxID=3365658 RepID=UPI0037A2C7D6